MKLSEAIALGGMTDEQIIGGDPTQGSCAAVSALKAIGKLEKYWIDGSYIKSGKGAHEAIEIEWPWTAKRITCPQCSIAWCSIGYMIAYCLNDSHRWTRSQIAAFVATRELKEGGIADNINLSSEVNEQTLTPGLTSLGVSCQG